MRSAVGIAAVSVAATTGTTPAAGAQHCQADQACRGIQIQPDKQTQAGLRPRAPYSRNARVYQS